MTLPCCCSYFKLFQTSITFGQYFNYYLGNFYCAFQRLLSNFARNLLLVYFIFARLSCDNNVWNWLWICEKLCPIYWYNFFMNWRGDAVFRPIKISLTIECKHMEQQMCKDFFFAYQFFIIFFCYYVAYFLSKFPFFPNTFFACNRVTCNRVTFLLLFIFFVSFVFRITTFVCHCLKMGERENICANETRGWNHFTEHRNIGLDLCTE